MFPYEGFSKKFSEMVKELPKIPLTIVFNHINENKLAYNLIKKLRNIDKLDDQTPLYFKAMKSSYDSDKFSQFNFFKRMLERTIIKITDPELNIEYSAGIHYKHL